MDARLVSWVGAVKSRRRPGFPVVWLFTDANRTPDPVGAVRGLPRGCGVVFRHDGVPGRPLLARAVLAACRAGGHRMVMTPPVIAGAGLHVRGGRRPDARQMAGLVTSSAHSRLQVLRACSLGARVIFLSPLFRTQSHPGQTPLGRLRWLRMGLGHTDRLGALGGVSAATVRALPPSCAGFGAIGGLADCGPAATVFHDCHA